MSNTTQNNCDLRYRSTCSLSLVRFHVVWDSGHPSPCFQGYKFYKNCFILICSDAKLLQLCLTLCDPMDCSLPGFSVHGASLGKNTGMGCHDLLQGIFPIQGLNPHLLCLLGGFFTTSTNWEALSDSNSQQAHFRGTCASGGLWQNPPFCLCLHTGVLPPWRKI